jgi:anti-anti-sigma factor
MELKVSHQSGYVLASTKGPIDASAEKTFREQLVPLVGRGGTNLVLDLSQSNLISSQGVGQLVTLVAHANTHSSRVILAACSSFVSIVLTRCKLDKFFETAPTVAGAVQSLGS